MRGFRRTPSFPLWLLLAAFFGVFAASALAERVEDLPKPTDYVSDYAHVLSPQAIAHLDSLCAQLDHSQANAQIAIVTVQTLDGDDVDDFSNRLATKWSMGQKGSGRGLLMLFAIQDHRRRIEVGGGLQGILPDAKVGDIGREMVPYLRANDFDAAVTLGLEQVGQVIAADAKVTLSDDAPLAARRPAHHGPALGKVILILILLLFFGGFHLLRFLLGFGLLSGMGGRGPWIGGGGGGFGGGGDSGGGGFGGFGGGGDFDGGGAGGSW